MDSNPPTDDSPPRPPRWSPVMGGRFVSALVAAGCASYLATHYFPSGAHSRAWKYMQTDKKVLLEDDITVGLYAAAAVGFAIAVLLCLTAQWWAVRMDAASREKARSPVWFWPSILIAAALSLWLRAPLAAGSLWWDELWNVKHTTVGYFKADERKEDGYRFLARNWEDVLWKYHKPTNHPPYSVLSKLTLDGWRKGAAADEGTFSEVAVRIPALAAGTLAILGAGLLLRAWGMPLAGVLCAFFLSLHPWVIRYGVDARAYSLNLLLIVAGMSSVWAMMRSLKWRWCILFALTQWLLVWALPIGVFYAAGFALAAFAGVFLPAHHGMRFPLVARIVAMNAFAAIAFAFCFAPNFLQMQRWGEINDYQFLDARILADTFSSLFTGMPWTAGPGFPALSAFFESRPILATLGLGGLVLGFGAGFVRLGLKKDDRMPVAIVVSLAASVAGALLLHLALDLHFYPRYLIYLLPVICIVTSAGIAGWSTRRKADPGRSSLHWLPWVATGLGVMTGLAWIGLTSSQRDLLRSRSYTAFREVANYKAHEQGSDNRLLVCYGLGGRMLPVYARDAVHANSLAELESYIGQARREGKQLVLVYAYREFNSGHPDLKDGFALIDDPSVFSKAAVLPGIEGLFEFHVLELKS